LLLEFFQPASFNNTTLHNIPEFYNEIAYFSMITFGTIGYGDITPATASARLMSAFFGFASQFYMITLVGIIVSRFSSRRA
jgi:voltage-gated potassium channel